MIVRPIKTDRISPGSISLEDLLDKYITKLEEKSVVAVTSKVISICEGSTIPIDKADKEQLIKDNSDYYLPSDISRYGYHFTITRNTLISVAGIDESNGGGNYVLWPEDPQRSANYIREYLAKKFGLKYVGAVITDSTTMPFRIGTIGITIAHSGFQAVNNYVGEPDLFGRPFRVSHAGVANGLAASAVVVMGEGTEQTPIVLMSDLPFIDFQDRNPNQEELEALTISRDEDLYAPFLNGADWKKGGLS
jgi:putative folate metabolism gamma-glutamate ligase